MTSALWFFSGILALVIIVVVIGVACVSFGLGMSFHISVSKTGRWMWRDFQETWQIIYELHIGRVQGTNKDVP